MTIITKLDIGNTAWLIYNNVVTSAPIIGIEYKKNSVHVGIVSYIMEVEHTTGKKHPIIQTEKHVFSTKKELIDSL